MSRVSWSTAMWILVQKDLRIEGRALGRGLAVAAVAVLLMLLFSLGVGPDPQQLARTAPAFLWLVLVVSSLNHLHASMMVEENNSALAGLRMMAVRPAAFYWAKVVMNFLTLLTTALVVTPVTVAVCGLTLDGQVRPFLGILVLGMVAVAIPGTLFALMTSAVRARDVLLPLLLFPLLTPGLVAAVKGSTLILWGDPMGELRIWVQLLVVWVAIFSALCTLLASKVLES